MVVAGSLALGACGSSSPKVSSPDFISKCKNEPSIKSALQGNAARLDSLCRCLQQKLVAGGFGNRTTNDKSHDINVASRSAAVACARQL
jgi:hypothetical protein